MSGEEANSVCLEDPLQSASVPSKETARSQGCSEPRLQKRTPNGSSSSSSSNSNSNSNSNSKNDKYPEGSEDKQNSDHPLSIADPTVRPHNMHHPLSSAADQGHTSDHHAALDDVKGTKNARLGIRAHGNDRAGFTDSSTHNAASKNSEDSAAPPAAPLAHLQSEPSATPSTTLAKTADLQRPPVTTTRAVSASASPLLLEPAVEATPFEKSMRQRPTPKHSSTAPPPSSQSRHQPLEHLTDMGPLDIERAIDSGVHWDLGSSAAPESPLPAEPSALPRQLLHRPSTSTSTVISDSSRSSSKVDPLSATDQSDQSSEAGSLTWRGEHPLLLGYTAEPDIMDEEDAPVDTTASRNRDLAPRLRNRPTSLRHKGHSMSVDNHQGSISRQPTEVTFPALGPGARRRRNISKEAEDKDAISYRAKNHVHPRATTEAPGKRVIIHQVCITDTLAGIALFYGIQVTVLKKCNKLWTNDSIHTRKYLYIPFEECTVARQAGVTIDESNHIVILPQRVQQNHHTRTGSLVPQSSHQDEQGSVSMDSIAETNGHIGSSGSNLPDTQPSTGGGHIVSGLPGKENSVLPPPISAVAARMLPSSSSSTITPSPRLGTWNDPKSLVAPPLSSHAVTTTTHKADSRMGSSALTPRRASTFTSGARPASSMAPLSENLPDTMVVSPSMTHEALAARFKEMDLVSTEQQHRKSMALGQELRINPIHHRHRTTDLRQYAHLQKQPPKQVDSARSSRSSSNAGSRRASSDVGSHETMANGVCALATAQVDGRHGGKGNYHIIEEEDDNDQGKQQQQHDESMFVTYGHHQHFYETDDTPSAGNGTGGREGLEHQSAGENGTTLLRRQELVTVPSGMLSFFPSPEHSKKLETPRSIARLPDRTDSYHSSSWSSSSTSSGSFRSLQRSQNGTPRTRGNRRAALGEHTFQPPPSSNPTLSGSSSHPPKPSQDRRTVSSSAVHPAAVADSGSKTAGAHSKSMRVHQPYYGAQRWSLMGESLVDELLGAVRGPLQIARRMYNFTTHGFGTVLGGGSSGGKDADFDPPGLLRRSSSARRPRSQRSQEYRHSGVAIELDQTHTAPSAAVATATATATPSMTTTTTAATTTAAPIATTKRSPVVTVVETPLPEGGGTHRSSRRKNGSTGGHGRASSSGSTHSARKRSLRSSHPVNHAALMALVNELDKDKKEQDKVMSKEKNPTAGPGLVGSPSPVVDILATSL